MTSAHLAKAALPRISIEIADQLSPTDIDDLCDAADTVIEAGCGFGWVQIPARETLERYWHGVLAVPERHLLLARIDGVICGAAQVVEPSRRNEARMFSASLVSPFTAPYAQDHKVSQKLVETAERLAIEMGYKVLHLDLRETQDSDIQLYESMGYKRWGTNPHYAFVGGRMVAGHYYSKTIDPVFMIKSV